MPTNNNLLAVLSRHIGKGNGITVKTLMLAVGISARSIRKIISDLREEGHAICGTPTDGYFVASTAEELEHTCQFLRSRALHSLTLESRLRKIPLSDLLGQLHLPT